MKQKKKFWYLILVFAVMLTVGNGISFVQAKAEGKSKGETFTVGFDAEFPPYGYKDDDGEYTGFDLKLAQEVCDRRGWTLKKQPIDWDSKDMELNSKAIDCIWNGFTINGKEDKYTWSAPYVDNSQVVLVNKDSGIEKLSDLAGKIVVVQADSSAKAALVGEDATEENQALQKSFGQMQEVSDYNSAVMNLESGAVDAICLDIGVAKYQQGSHKDLDILDETIATENYGIGFKKGNTELRNQVQETLNEMIEDGTVEKIAQEYEKYNLPECLILDGDKEIAKDADAGSVEKNKTNHADQMGNIILQLTKGFGSTLLIFCLTILFSLPLGLVIAFGRMSRFTILRGITKFYISIMRGTPLMLQLLVVFFGPYYIFGIRLAPYYRFVAVIIGFSLNYAAYFAEIYRSGIENIPAGQREAAKLLGYTRSQTFCRIIFPQMVKRVMPPVTNEIITLVKDTSLAFVVAYAEMFTLAKQIAATLTNILPLVVAGVFYYIFNYVIAFIMEQIEKKLNYYQ